jgi:hypothetical protein
MIDPVGKMKVNPWLPVLGPQIAFAGVLPSSALLGVP